MTNLTAEPAVHDTNQTMDWTRLLCTERARPSSSVPTGTRTAFDLDYDRAVFSAPVRRLQDKAQVFPLEPNDSVRTRLTHSLEVSTVARSLVRQALDAVRQDPAIPDALKPTDEQTREVETIAATSGLIHDLGNPPFGHSGEAAIAQWFDERAAVHGFFDDPRMARGTQAAEDFLRFEGNAQTIRLVSRLQVLADQHGLNLTFGTLSACGKYVAPAHLARPDHPQPGHRKPGYFASEADLVARVRAATGTGDARNPIAFLVEAADDIVYSACDLEDAVRKGVLSWPALTDALRHEAAADDLDAAAIDEAIDRVQTLMESRGSDPLAVAAGTLDDRLMATALRTRAHGMAIGSAVDAFRTNYLAIMRGTFTGDLVSAEAGPGGSVVQACKRVGRTRVYGAGSNPVLELMGRRVIHDLMDIFWEGAREADGSNKTRTYPQKINAIISRNYLEVMLHALRSADSGLPEMYHRLQLVTDFVCGMTDNYARTLHRGLSGH